MSNVFKAFKITDDIYWVGAIDWHLQEFHGYMTPRGTTYNAYLVKGEKIALIDTVKAPYKAEFFDRISSIINPRDIDYLISNHAEMDHSGCLLDAIDFIQPEKVLASNTGVKALQEHFGNINLTAVNNGDKLSLGDKNLVFFETKMLHWPDSMVTYCPERKILFSQDAFGMHLASNEHFNHQIPHDVLQYEAAKYFANILMPFSDKILSTIPKLLETGIEIKTIAPDHGPIWNQNPEQIVTQYLKWAKQEISFKAVIIFDTMWGSTAKMALALNEGLQAEGALTIVMPQSKFHRSDIVTELLDAGAILIGSPTINGQLYPATADILSYIKGLKPKHRIGMTFGSYGWSGEATKLMQKEMDEIGIEMVGEPFKVKYVPTQEHLQQCYEIGRVIAIKLKEKINSKN